MSSQNLEVAIKLRADVAHMTSGVTKAANDFNHAMSGMGNTATETGSRVDAAMEKIGMRKHADINKDIRSVEQAYRDLAASGELSEKELAQASEQTKAKIRELREQTGSWQKSLGAMKGELIAAGAALYGLNRVVGGATREASGFATAMAEVSTLLDDTSSIDGLSDSVRELAREYGGSAQGQAKALYQVISAGAQDATQATEYLTVANKLAIGGVTDITTAADGLTSILNAYSESAGGAASVSDAMFVAMKAGKTTIGELSNAVGQVAPLAAQAGVGMEELLGATAALTKGGLKTSEAMTQLRAIVAAVVKPTKEAADTAKELGIDFNTTAIRGQGLAKWLEEIKQKTGGSEEEMAKLFGSVEALGAVFALTGNASADFAAIMESMETKAGQTDAAFNKMAESPEMAARRFKSALGDMQISIGQAVTALAPLLEVVTDAINGFNDLPGPIKSTVAAVGLAAVAIPALVLSLSSLTKALGILRTAFAGQLTAQFVSGIGAATAATNAATAATGLLSKALRAAPWALAATAIYETADALWEWKKAADEADAAEARYNETNARLQELFARLSEETGTAITNLQEFTQAKRDGIVVFDESKERWISATEAQEKLAAATKKAAEEQERQNEWMARTPASEQAKAITEAGIATQKWAESFAAVDVKAEDAAKKVRDLLDAANLADHAEMAGLLKSLNEVKQESVELGQLIEKELTGRIEELDSQGLATLSASLKAAFDAGTINAQQFAERSATLVEQAAQRMGIDIDAALGATTKGTANALADIQTLADGMIATGRTTQETGQVISVALSEAFSNAKTTADIEAIREKIYSLGDQSALTGFEMEEMAAQATAALDNMAAKAGTSTNSTAESIKTVRKEVTDLASDAKEATDAIQQQQESLGGVGDAVAGHLRRLRDEFAAMGESAAAAFDDMLEGSTIAGESVHRFVERFNTSIVKLRTQLQDAAEQQGKWADYTIDSLQGLETASDRTLNAALRSAEGMDYLDQTRLDGIRSEVERLRHANEQLQESIQSTVRDLRDELDQMDGNRAAIEQRDYEERKAELERQLDAARQTADRQAQSEAEEALRLLEEIHRRKLEQIKEEAEARKTEYEDRQTRETKPTTPAPSLTTPAPERQTTAQYSRLVRIEITCKDKRATVYAEDERDLIRVLEDEIGVS